MRTTPGALKHFRHWKGTQALKVLKELKEHLGTVLSRHLMHSKGTSALKAIERQLRHSKGTKRVLKRLLGTRGTLFSRLHILWATTPIVSIESDKKHQKNCRPQSVSQWKFFEKLFFTKIACSPEEHRIICVLQNHQMMRQIMILKQKVLNQGKLAQESVTLIFHLT